MFSKPIPCMRSVRNTAAALGLMIASGLTLVPMAAQAATSVSISGEISRITLTTPGDYWSVVEFNRVGDRQDAPSPCLHPEGLVVGRPVHQVAVTGLLEQVGRDLGF